jgi:PTH1 family peptidyl-tRNA hydrolase
MKIIVGLGNPGSQYTKTRHNCGFMVIDRLVQKFAPAETVRGRFNSAVVEAGIGGERCLLMKPTTYMNRSGLAVGEAAGFFKVDITRDVLVITDDLALPVGTVRLRPGGGAGGHNGLEDLRRALGSESFPRLRVGIGAKPAFMDQADYVVSRFTEIEEPALDASLDKAASACEVFITKGLDAAMNHANAPPPDPNRPKKPPPDRPGLPEAVT